MFVLRGLARSFFSHGCEAACAMPCALPRPKRMHIRRASSTTGSIQTVTQVQNTSPVDMLLQGARLTQGAHYAWSLLVQPGDIVVDATCGNGHDTVEMARLVGSTGQVFAFDIQADALQSAQQLLNEKDDQHMCRNVVFVQACHSTMQDVVGSNIARVVAFNLGYLPGGDKSVTTSSNTTLQAVECALEVVTTGGVVSIVSYTGHPGGLEEYDAVRTLISQLPPAYWVVMEHRLLNRPKAPILLLAWRR